MRESLGKVASYDSEALPSSIPVHDFPWRFAAALAGAYLFAYFGWHWAYVLPLFWVLVHMDERRQQNLWANMLHEATSSPPLRMEPSRSTG